LDDSRAREESPDDELFFQEEEMRTGD